MAEVLTTSQLRRLTEHKYSAEGCSVLEPYMQVFWRWLVEQIPRTWAPNALTLTGLIVNVFTTCILILYSPDARGEVPAWALTLCAVGLFIYQGLDAIDGKQARRTNSSSPLGELFDHGCDAMSIVFVAIGTCIAMGLGELPGWMFCECFAVMFIFYAAHWQTYVSGTLKFGRVDVTEAQFLVMATYLFTALFGTGFWGLAIPVLGIQIKVILCYVSVFIGAMALQAYFAVIFMEGGSGKNGSTIAGTSVLSPLLPIGVFIILALMISQKSTTLVYQLHPCLYILSFGFAITKITNKLVIAHMTKSEMGMLDSILIGPGMLFFNQYFNTPVREETVLWLCFFYCLIDLLRFSITVCSEICNFLNIYCFKIKEQRRQSAEKTSENGSGKIPENGAKAANQDQEYSSPLTRSKARQPKSD